MLRVTELLFVGDTLVLIQAGLKRHGKKRRRSQVASGKVQTGPLVYIIALFAVANSAACFLLLLFLHPPSSLVCNITPVPPSPPPPPLSSILPTLRVQNKLGQRRTTTTCAFESARSAEVSR